MTEYKEIEIKEALMRYVDGEIVYYRYFTNGGYSWIGSLGLDHLRRNPERYTFYIEEPKKTLCDKILLLKQEERLYSKDKTQWIDRRCFSEEDVKEALNKFLVYCTKSSDINTSCNVIPIIKQFAKEIFGKELLK